MIDDRHIPMNSGHYMTRRDADGCLTTDPNALFYRVERDTDGQPVRVTQYGITYVVTCRKDSNAKPADQWVATSARRDPEVASTVPERVTLKSVNYAISCDGARLHRLNRSAQ